MTVIECPLARAAKSDLDARSQLKSFSKIAPSSALAPEAVIDNTAEDPVTPEVSAETMIDVADKDPVTPEVPAEIMIDGTDKDSTTPVAVIQAEIEPAPSSVFPVLPTTAPSTGTIDKQDFEEADDETRIEMICAAYRAIVPIEGCVEILDFNSWLGEIDNRAMRDKAMAIMKLEDNSILWV